MTLDPQVTFPVARSYVLKLRRDACPDGDALAGRLENLSSGRRFEFGNAEELLACLADDLTSTVTKE